ncbi:MAG: ABC transporter permease [Methanospirillum sp.]|nr:ABC transporter permease [Methanospirillum sp.]
MQKKGSGRLFLPLASVLSVFSGAIFFLVLGGLFTFISPESIVQTITSPEIGFAVQLSLVTSVISTCLCAVVAIPTGYILSRGTLPGKRPLVMLLMLPLSLPPLVAGVALLLFFARTPFGTGLEDMGITVVYTQLGIVVAQWFVNLPYLIRVMRSSFAMISPRYEHIARTLGCTDFQAFWHVTLPMARAGLISGLVITWSKAMGEFGAVLMLAGATRMHTETLPIALYLNMATGDLDIAITTACILLGIAAVTMFFFERLSDGSERI